MKKNILRLILPASVLYFAVLFLARGLLPPDVSPPLYFLVGPFLLVVLILVSDLSARAASPSETALRHPPSRTLARKVKLLTGQISVAEKASPEYFESVLLLRLRDILADKVSLETGMEKEGVLELMGDPGLGAGLLRDEGLYRLLYRKPVRRGTARVRLLKEAVERVEAWKP